MSQLENSSYKSKKTDTEKVLEPLVILGTGEPWQKPKKPLVFKRFFAYLLDYLFLFSLISLIRGLLLNIFFSNLQDLSEKYLTLNSLFFNFLEKQITLRESENLYSLTSLYSKIFFNCELPTNWNYNLQACLEVANFLKFSNLLSSLLTLLFFSVYNFLLPISPWQATLGKKVLGLKIVNLQGQKITLLQSFARHFLWFIYHLNWFFIFLNFSQVFFLSLHQIIIFCFLINIFLIPLDSKKQGIHDKIAQTIVTSQKD